jgi:CheY-like chemotaxis protein
MEIAMTHTLPQRRILIVDDDEQVALGLRDSLETLPNCEVAVATDGTQALHIFGRQPFDLLITDYQMPGMDGIALAKRVRRLYPQTAIIMITAYGSETLHGQVNDVSIQRILDKPARIVEIRSAVSEVLGDRVKQQV